MTYSDFYRLYVDTGDCKDFDQYVAECGGSVCDDDVQHVLQYIWDYAQNPSPATVRAASGLSQVAFGAAYGIPRRSIEDWEAGVRTAPIYSTHMMSYAVMTDVCARK